MAKELRPNWPTTPKNNLPKQGGLAKGGLFCNAKCIFVFSLMTLSGYLLGYHKIFFIKMSLFKVTPLVQAISKISTPWVRSFFQDYKRDSICYGLPKWFKAMLLRITIPHLLA
jgi:hypothetical protein